MKRSKISENLRIIRVKRNLTQQGMSDLLNMDIRVYQRIESPNPPDIRLSTLLKILAALNIRLEDLIQ